jgi:hypothetical protein
MVFFWKKRASLSGIEAGLTLTLPYIMDNVIWQT